MTGQPAGTWRISDADRLAAVEALGEHYATGRLDKAEYDERSDRVMAARSSTDLPPLFADLPLPHGTVAVTPVRRAVPLVATPTPYRRRGFVPGPWLLLLIPLVFLVAHAPFLLIVPLVLFVLARRGGHWSGRGPVRGRRAHW